jgi:hypothetical protein
MGMMPNPECTITSLKKFKYYCNHDIYCLEQLFSSIIVLKSLTPRKITMICKTGSLNHLIIIEIGDYLLCTWKDRMMLSDNALLRFPQGHPFFGRHRCSGH